MKQVWQRHYAGWARARALAACALGLFLLVPRPTAGDTNAPDFKTASFDELLVNAQRYATTEAKTSAKRAAREELFARGSNSLAYLMSRMEVENMWIRILAEEVVLKLKAEDAAPILLKYLADEHPITRKSAAYLLGYYVMPARADVLMPLLGDEEAMGVALRTLGKWHVTNAIPQIVPFLTHPKERNRIFAVNALRDIGDSRAAPDLLRALDDPYFTVRKAASRALVTLGMGTEKTLLVALVEPGRSAVARRELIRCLGALHSRKATAVLRKLLADPDSMVRQDAAQALRAIDPDHAGRWLKDAKFEGGNDTE